MALSVDMIGTLIERNAAGESWASLVRETKVGKGMLMRWVARCREVGPEGLEDVILVPLEPLEREIARRGGVGALVSGCPITVERNPGQGSVPNVIEAIERTPEEEALIWVTRSRLDRARERGGLINYYIADEIACDVLGSHPAEIYGRAWFDFPSTHQVGVRSSTVLAQEVAA